MRQEHSIKTQTDWEVHKTRQRFSDSFMETSTVTRDLKNLKWWKLTHASDALRRKLSNTCWQNAPIHIMSGRCWVLCKWHQDCAGRTHLRKEELEIHADLLSSIVFRKNTLPPTTLIELTYLKYSKGLSRNNKVKEMARTMIDNHNTNGTWH